MTRGIENLQENSIVKLNKKLKNITFGQAEPQYREVEYG